MSAPARLRSAITRHHAVVHEHQILQQGTLQACYGGLRCCAGARSRLLDLCKAPYQVVQRVGRRAPATTAREGPGITSNHAGDSTGRPCCSALQGRRRCPRHASAIEPGACVQPKREQNGPAKVVAATVLAMTMLASPMMAPAPAVAVSYQERMEEKAARKQALLDSCAPYPRPCTHRGSVLLTAYSISPAPVGTPVRLAAQRYRKCKSPTPTRGHSGHASSH